MGPRSWQSGLKDAFSGLNLPSDAPPTPPGSLPRYGSPPQPYHYQTIPPIPPRPSPPIPQHPQHPQQPHGVVLRALRLLELPVIEAELVLPSGQVVLRRQNLDIDLGNDNGSFEFGGRYFSKSARNVYVHDSTLYAELATRDGQWYPDKVGIEVDFPDDLRLVDITIRTVEYHVSHSPNVPNERSRLAVGPQEDVHSLRLISGFVLAAECRQADSTYATSYVDLDAHIRNDHGVFNRDGRFFSGTADDIRLTGTTLQAKLGDGNGSSPERNIDVSRILRCPSCGYDRGIPDKSPLSGCRSAHLVGRHILVARCVLRGGKSKEAAFKLDKLFGMADYRIRAFGHDSSSHEYDEDNLIRPFGHDFNSNENVEDIKLEGSILSVLLKDKRERTVDLDEFIANVNGKLELKKQGPCSRCSNAFRANRLYSLMGDRHRERLNFDITDVNRECALCQIIESIINATVPFIRSCEVHIECWSKYFGKYPIKTVELEIAVNNINRKYRLYLDSDKPTTSKAYDMMPVREHSTIWFQPS